MTTTGPAKRRHLVSGDVEALVSSLSPAAITLIRPRNPGPVAGEVSTIQAGNTTVFSIRLAGLAHIEQAGGATAVYLSAPTGLAVELTEPSRTFAIEGNGILYRARSRTRMALKADSVLRGVVFGEAALSSHSSQWFPERPPVCDRVARYDRVRAAPIDRFIDYLVREALLETESVAGPLALARQMSTLADLVLEQDVEQGQTPLPEWSVAPRHLKRAEDYVLDNLAGDLSIEGIAEAAGVSRRSLHRAFQDFRGLSLGQFVRNARIEAACKLVSNNPTLSLKVAASRVGYADYSSFWRHYRARFGTAPSERSERLAA